MFDKMSQPPPASAAVVPDYGSTLPGVPERILISHVYSMDNKGDAALLDVLIQQLRTRFPRARLRIHTLDEVPAGSDFNGVPQVRSLMHYALRGTRHRAYKLARSLALIAVTRLDAWSRRRLRLRVPMNRAWRAVVDDYTDADLVVGVGGGYLRGRETTASTVELLLLTHPFGLAAALGTPTELASMSVGPFYGRWQRRIFVRAMRHVDRIFVRENISMRVLDELGVSAHAERAIDAGFSFRTEETIGLRRRLGLPANRLLVGITVRTWLGPEEQRRYETAVATAADHLIERYGAAVVFIPQVTSVRNRDDDRVTSRDVRRAMTHPDSAWVWEESTDHHHVKAMYGELDALIGTRFHSVIFALTAGVPAIALEYEHKTRGIMADLGLSRWVLDVDTVQSAELVDLVDLLVTDLDEYRAGLAATIPAYVSREPQAAT
ncbi:MAG: polysaccharide pyruvyl transferase family protein [Nocardioides sp.]